MKTGEIWKYRQWVAKLIDENMKDYLGGPDLASTAQIRIKITKIDNDVVWFREFREQDSEHNIKRETFVQIFEKVYGEQ